MIDLTPLEVRKKKGDFKRAMRGYDPGLVDDFLELVADRLEELVRSNLGHDDRVRQLEQQLRDYKERERALTDALVSAQELREEMREQAVRDAETARREAEQEADQIRTNVAQEIEREEQTLRRLRARQAQLAQSYRALLEREMEELEVIEGGMTYRAELDEEVDAPRREALARRETAPRRESTPRAEAEHAEEEAEPAATTSQAASESPAAETSYARERRPQTVREAPRGYGAAPAASAPATGAADDRRPEPRDDRSAAREAIEGADEDEEVDDEALERSLEALQVVFARDEAEVRQDWPVPTVARGTQERSTSSFAEPPVDEADEDAAPRVDEVPVALEEDSRYDEELLLEDAIDEEEAEDAEPQTAAAVDPWLPKLIEDAP